jgi:glucokinase
MPDSPQTMLGIDLGGTDCKIGVVDRTGRVLVQGKFPTRAELGPQGVLENIANEVRKFLQSDASFSRPGGIGMGVPGPMSSRHGIVYEAPNLPGWKNVPVASVISSHLDQPVVLCNDANAAAWGEFWGGTGQRDVGVSSMVFYTLGTGVGGGIILNGALLEGPDDTAGELGHMVIDTRPDAPQCGCGNRGCLEAIASATAVKRRVLEQQTRGDLGLIQIPADGHFGARAVFEAAEKGCSVARGIFHEVGEALGVAIANMINALNPDQIVLGGAMAGAGHYILDPLRARAKANSFAKPFSRVRIEPARLGADAGIVGAAGMAFRRGEGDYL